MKVSRDLVLAVEFCKIGVGHGGRYAIIFFQYLSKPSDLVGLS